MNLVLRHGRLLGAALIASLLIHLIVAIVLPKLAWVSDRAPSVEAISFTHVRRITIVRRRPVIPPTRVSAPHHAARPVLARTPSGHTAGSHRRVSHLPSRRSSAVAPVIGAVSAGSSNTGVAPAASPHAVPTAAQRDVASVQSRSAPGGYLPLGAEQPDPVLNPDVLKSLQALGVHTTLVITVGENGKTETVVFQPPIDEAMQARIEALLADATWDPAVCGGGIPCEGRTTIKL